MAKVVSTAHSFSDARIATIVEKFNREGWVHLPCVLTPDEVAELLAGIERVRCDPTAKLMYYAGSSGRSSVCSNANASSGHNCARTNDQPGSSTDRAELPSH